MSSFFFHEGDSVGVSASARHVGALKSVLGEGKG